jgi:hypothetical protein
MVDTFNDSLEKVINENQHRDEPYFLSYHENDDNINTQVIRGKWNVSDDLPIRWARQIVYWVDNKKGFREWLWTVDDEKKTHFNVDGIKKAKASGALVLKNK